MLTASAVLFIPVDSVQLAGQPMGAVMVIGQKRGFFPIKENIIHGLSSTQTHNGRGKERQFEDSIFYNAAHKEIILSPLHYLRISIILDFLLLENIILCHTHHAWRCQQTGHGHQFLLFHYEFTFFLSAQRYTIYQGGSDYRLLPSIRFE